MNLATIKVLLVALFIMCCAMVVHIGIMRDDKIAKDCNHSGRIARRIDGMVQCAAAPSHPPVGAQQEIDHG